MISLQYTRGWERVHLMNMLSLLDLFFAALSAVVWCPIHRRPSHKLCESQRFRRVWPLLYRSQEGGILGLWWTCITLIKRTFPSRKIQRFYLHSLPTHHHATWPVTMENGQKSGLQISWGDLVSFLPLYRHLAFPSYFLGGVRGFVGPQLPHRQLFYPYGRPTHIHAPTNMHTPKQIHCCCKQRDVKRKCRRSVVAAADREAEEPMPTTAGRWWWWWAPREPLFSVMLPPHMPMHTHFWYQRWRK